MLFLFVIIGLTTAPVPTMPLYNNVKCLESLALNEVCKYILNVTPKMKKDVNKSRGYYINNVHAWARTKILICTKFLL